jgi:transaldolase
MSRYKLKRYIDIFYTLDKDKKYMSQYKTKIYLDSSNPEDTSEALKILGFLDGQTTNPSLFAKVNSNKYSETEVWKAYKTCVQSIHELIPEGSVSAEIYADTSSTVNQMLIQSERIQEFGEFVHIKIPTCTNGIKTLETLVSQNKKVNMTLGFDQNQAFAIANIAKDTTPGQIYYSSFIGRLFDNGVNGIENLKNIKQMYKELNSPVFILACSFRSLDQFLACMALEVDIVTVSLDILKEWQKHNFTIPALSSFHFDGVKTNFIPIEELDSTKVDNPLSLAGIHKFATDWNSIIA